MKINGVNHLALVCRDMGETVKFYTEVLDMPLVKTVALPDGGQHFFFDCGGGACLAFFCGRRRRRPRRGSLRFGRFPPTPRPPSAR